MKTINYYSSAYRTAFSHINGVVIMGETHAAQHFQKLAKAIHQDHDELMALAAMEARHARDFVGCGRELGITAAIPMARRLFQPLHSHFCTALKGGCLVRPMVIQGLIIECFAIAAYHCYLPVADPYAKKITAKVIDDEHLHLNYAERWLKANFAEQQEVIAECCRTELATTMTILKELWQHLVAIGIDPVEVVAEFVSLFNDTLIAIGFHQNRARAIGAAAIARALA
ncbi:long-chain fatty aldehyde decarbonylase [Synechococcus sp. UW140]|uniref:long-chain fatty aldehyde decarbonylase n=1 Tax=Synechococcus sp. UW140 TaxID=368503 RepID=UPI0031384721